MHVTEALGNLLADSLSFHIDKSKKEITELEPPKELILECMEFLKNEEDYKDFKISIFNYITKKHKKLNIFELKQKYYPELYI